jgi:hypothetical protein
MDCILCKITNHATTSSFLDYVQSNYFDCATTADKLLRLLGQLPVQINSWPELKQGESCSEITTEQSYRLMKQSGTLPKELELILWGHQSDVRMDWQLTLPIYSKHTISHNDNDNKTCQNFNSYTPAIISSDVTQISHDVAIVTITLGKHVWFIERFCDGKTTLWWRIYGSWYRTFSLSFWLGQTDILDDSLVGNTALESHWKQYRKQYGNGIKLSSSEFIFWINHDLLGSLFQQPRIVWITQLPVAVHQTAIFSSHRS